MKSTTSFSGYDYMIKFNVPYKNRVDYPCEASVLFQDLCDQVGVSAGNLDFVNANYLILGNPFTNNEKCREVLSNLAKLAGGFAKVGRDNKIYIQTLKRIAKPTTLKEIDESSLIKLKSIPINNLSQKLAEKIDGNNYFDDFSKNNVWGPLNVLSLNVSSMDGEETIKDNPESIEKDKETKVNISDNYFLVNQIEREKAIKDIWETLQGIKYLPFSSKYYGFPYLDSGDPIYISDTKDVIYVSYVFNHKFTYNGSFSGKIETQALTKMQQKYKSSEQPREAIKRAERSINRIDGILEDLIEETDNFSEKLSIHKQDIDSITNQIQQIYDFEKKVSGKNELLLEDALPVNILRLEVDANTVKGIYPSKKLFPSKRLFPKKGGTTITVVIGRTSRLVVPDPILPSKRLFPSKKIFPRSNGYYKREYSFYISKPLRHHNNIHDKFIIEADEEKGVCIAKVLRYVNYNYDTGAVSIANSPEEEIIGETDLQLYKGNNYIYIKEFTDWNMQATYIFNNELNERYATRFETNSLFRITKEEITLQMSEKAGKDELISIINLTPGLIKMEGYTSINGGFAIDREGNASIANDTVKINKKGIQLADGASIVNAKGLYSNLQYISSGLLGEDFGGQFSPLGVMADFTNGSSFYKSDLVIDVYIPENFIVTSAILSIMHTSVHWVGYDAMTNKNYDVIGIAKNVHVYKTNSNYNFELTQGGGASTPTIGYLSEINGALGEKGYSFKNINLGNIEEVKSANIGDSLEQGYQKIIIRTTDNANNVEDSSRKTGLAYAVLNITGYLSVV